MEEIKQSFNIKQGQSIYLKRLDKILAKIKDGCIDRETGKNDFKNCPICQADYSVQWADVAITMLHEDGLIDKKTANNILSKLYDGHRG